MAVSCVRRALYDPGFVLNLLTVHMDLFLFPLRF